MRPIKIFVRHCNISKNSIGKNRPEWFSREGCWINLKNTIDSATNITVLFDGKPDDTHFLKNETDINIVYKTGGSDAHASLNLLQYVQNLNIDDDDIIYFLEDDFLHIKGWTNILREGFEYISADYITLYDHYDKYTLNMYEELQSKILVTPSIHWRTTPSTTNTYAMLGSTFKKHYDIHVSFCNLDKGITHDHDKFLKLWSIGSNLISCIPGYSTHCDDFLSPIINWKTQI
jgi:hypothetical protein